MNNQLHLALSIEDEFGTTSNIEYCTFENLLEQRLKYIVENINDFSNIIVNRLDDNNVIFISFILNEEGANNWNPLRYIYFRDDVNLTLFYKNLRKYVEEAIKGKTSNVPALAFLSEV